MSQQQRGSDGPLGGTGPSSAMSQASLNQIVIEYLSKKGYSRTEAMLRTESAAHDPDGRPIIPRAENEGGKQWGKGMELLLTWIEGALDIYKPELRRLPWPLFVYSFLQMVDENYQEDSKAYMAKYKDRFINEHPDDIRKLEPIQLPEHVLDAEIAKIHHSNKYRLTLSNSAFFQLVQFLENNEKSGGSVLLAILNVRMNIVTVERASQDKMSLASMMVRSKNTEEFPAEDEGIPGHNPGSASTEQPAGSSVLTRLKLGPLPMEPELLGDVMATLEEGDARNPSIDPQRSLVQELDRRIKREESEEGPSRTDVPMPPSLARDVQMEVSKIREHRDRFKILPQADGNLPGVSVCMFTFHNTYESVNCIEISGNNEMIAVGTSESYIRVWSADGSPLPTLTEEEQPPNSRRLIGHSGPVYKLSFSPMISDPSPEDDPIKQNAIGARMLLSGSADKTVRLWHLGTWQCLVKYVGHFGPVWDISWGPFGYYFVTGCYDKQARLYNTESIAPLKVFSGHDQDVDVVCFHPNNLYVFTGSCDKTVRMWAANTGYCVRMFSGHTGNITSMECSPSGKILATADDAGMIILWDLLPGKLLKRMRGHDKGGIWSVSWSAESTALISGGMDGTVRVWDVNKRIDAHGQGKIIGEGGTGSKIDVAAGSQGAGGGAGKKKAKGTVVTSDQVSAFPTKKTPVKFVKFTRMNLAVAAGCYQP